MCLGHWYFQIFTVPAPHLLAYIISTAGSILTSLIMGESKDPGSHDRRVEQPRRLKWVPECQSQQILLLETSEEWPILCHYGRSEVRGWLACSPQGSFYGFKKTWRTCPGTAYCCLAADEKTRFTHTAASHHPSRFSCLLHLSRGSISQKYPLNHLRAFSSLNSSYFCPSPCSLPEELQILLSHVGAVMSKGR